MGGVSLIGAAAAGLPTIPATVYGIPTKTLAIGAAAAGVLAFLLFRGK